MLIYALLFLFLCSFIYIENIKIEKTRTLSLGVKSTISLVTATCLIVISAVRWHTGQDFATYLAIYNYIPSILSGDDIFRGYGNIEPGFKLLAAVAKAFDSHVVYFALCAALSLLPLCLGLKKFNKYKKITLSYGVLIYFCFFYINYNFNAMRQAIAMGFFIYSISYIYEKKSLKVFFISIFSALFHSTGLIILIGYIVSRFFLINSYKKFLFIIFLSFIAYKVDILTRILMVVGVNITRWQDLWGEVSLSSIILRLIIIGVLIFPKPIFKQGRLAALLFTLYMFGFFIYMALGSVDMMAARFNMFFRVLEVLLIPLLIASYNFKVNKCVQFLFLLTIYVLVLYVTASPEINNYKFYF